MRKFSCITKRTTFGPFSRTFKNHKSYIPKSDWNHLLKLIQDHYVFNLDHILSETWLVKCFEKLCRKLPIVPNRDFALGGMVLEDIAENMMCLDYFKTYDLKLLFYSFFPIWSEFILHKTNMLHGDVEIELGCLNEFSDSILFLTYSGIEAKEVQKFLESEGFEVQASIFISHSTSLGALACLSTPEEVTRRINVFSMRVSNNEKSLATCLKSQQRDKEILRMNKRIHLPKNTADDPVTRALAAEREKVTSITFHRFMQVSLELLSKPIDEFILAITSRIIPSMTGNEMNTASMQLLLERMFPVAKNNFRTTELLQAILKLNNTSDTQQNDFNKLVNYPIIVFPVLLLRRMLTKLIGYPISHDSDKKSSWDLTLINETRAWKMTVESILNKYAGWPHDQGTHMISYKNKLADLFGYTQADQLIHLMSKN